MARVAVVILNYNGRHFLQTFLPPLIKYSQGAEIIVADNFSTDDSAEFISSNYPWIRYIQHNENYGFCAGYNHALSDVEAEYFVILNSDIEVTPHWLVPVISLLDSDSLIAAVQPKILDFQRREKFEYAGGAGGYIDQFGYPFCRGRIFDTIETDTGQYDDTREIFWATGACLFIRAKLFKEFHGFDKDFFAHMEEIDLCWRLKSAGHKIMYCGQSVVYHVGGGTLPSSNPRKTYLNFRNSLLTLIKNLPAVELYFKLSFRWAVDYVAILKFLVTGKSADAWMILKAHWYIIAHFYTTLKKRNGAIHKKTSQHTGVFNGFLLLWYHLGNAKKFDDLMK